MSLARARACAAAGDWAGFYRTYAWQRVKAAALAADRHECQTCKAKGRYARATDVHHVNKVRARPDLALEAYYVGEGGETLRNLISLCRLCHLEADGLLFGANGEGKAPLTPERW